jgi:hypothetical protein
MLRAAFASGVALVVLAVCSEQQEQRYGPAIPVVVSAA